MSDNGDASDGDREDRKPAEFQTLLDLVYRQMEASQRREDRVVALLEQMSTGSHHRLDVGSPAATAAGPGAGLGAPPRLAPAVTLTAPAGGAPAGGVPAAVGDPSGPAPGRGQEPRGPAGGEAAAGSSGDRGQGAEARPRSRWPAAATPAPRLVSSASLKEFDSWRSKFDGYRLLVGLDEHPAAEQRAALLALMDDDWARVIRFALPLSSNDTVDDIITKMQEHLRRQRNVIIDRRDFNTRTQQPGETFDEFLCALKETASFCDFCASCMDDRLRDRLVVGVRDDSARRRMLESPELTLQSAADICRACENANASTSAIQGAVTSSLARMSRYQQNKRSQRSDDQRSGQDRTDRSRPTASGKCTRCGMAAHRDGQTCPAVGRTCHRCHGRDHFSAVCRAQPDELQRRKRSDSRNRRERPERHQRRHHVQSLVQVEQDSTPAPSREARHVTDIRVRGIAAQCSPRVQLQLHRPDGGGAVPTYWTPDTGAETSAVSLRYAEKMGVRRSDLKPVTSKLLSADNSEMQCLGTCSITLQLGCISHTVETAVVKRLNGPLLSWHDSIRLGILPKNYPQQIQSVKTGGQHDDEDDDVADGEHEDRRTEDHPPTRGASASAPASSGLSVEKPVQEHPVKRMTPPRWIPKTAGAASRGIPTLSERQAHFSEMKSAFSRVFDTSAPLREMSGGLMKIELTEDAVPVAVRTPRAIPFAWREEVRAQLDELVQKGVIEPVNHPTPCATHLCRCRRSRKTVQWRAAG